jgi:hypothetical protein
MHNVSSIVAYGITARKRLLPKPAKCLWEIDDEPLSERLVVCAVPPRLIDGWQLDRGFTSVRQQCAVCDDRDEPAPRVAGYFHDGTDQPSHERSLHCHGCFLAATLLIAAAPRDF